MNFEAVFKILDAAVFAKSQKHLKDVERFVLWGAWQGQTYEEMATASSYRYTSSYLKQTVGPKLWKQLSKALGEEVSKTNFQAALERQAKLREALPTQEPAKDLSVAENEGDTTNKCQNWGEAANVSASYGRTEEPATLEQWLVKDYYQLVALVCMREIAKTSPSVELTGKIQDELEYLIWRSLRNIPLTKEILINLLQFSSNEQESD